MLLMAGFLIALASAAPAAAPPPPAATGSPIVPGRPDIPSPTATLQAPPGADFEVRLDAFAADLEAVMRLGLLTESEAAEVAVQLTAVRGDLAGVKARNAGKAPVAETARLQMRLDALRGKTGALAAVSRQRRAGR